LCHGQPGPPGRGLLAAARQVVGAPTLKGGKVNSFPGLERRECFARPPVRGLFRVHACGPAYAERSVDLVEVNNYAEFDTMHSDQRYQDLVRRIAIPSAR